ncbi:MAG: hypothetical protein ACK4SZ_00140 [Allosphingosinicella sp.]|uniref:transporter n=1 Tax=Allosphingosinicella sp. TaxID=2823234 RepID=UPI00394E6469
MRVLMGAAVAAMLFSSVSIARAQEAQAEPAQPEGFGLSFSTGIDYSSGRYGQAEKTDILVVPMSARATAGRLSLTATLPYLRIDGPGGVVVGPGGDPLPGVPTAGGVRQGLGDLSLGATYTIPAEALSGFELGIGGRVKLPTSDEALQLSTGETDLAASADISYPIGNVIPFVNIGYRVLGDAAGTDLRDGPTASVGSSFVIGQSVLIASYDYAQSVNPAVADSHELFAGISGPITSRLNVTGYGVAGLSDGSPDFGIGVLISARLF